MHFTCKQTIMAYVHYKMTSVKSQDYTKRWHYSKLPYTEPLEVCANKCNICVICLVCSEAIS
jgi:hypothetical protein